MALPERLDVLGVFDGAFGFHPARVVDVLRLEQQNPHFLLGDGPVLDPLRHHDDLARAYTIEFHEMWGSDGATPDAANAKFGPDKSWNTPSNFLIGGSPVELYFSPSDGTTNAIRQEIEAADSEFEFALLAFTRDDLGEAIADLGESFFVNPIGAIEQVNTTGSEFETLQNSGVQVYAHNVSPDLHHKYAIVDHASPAKGGRGSEFLGKEQGGTIRAGCQTGQPGPAGQDAHIRQSVTVRYRLPVVRRGGRTGRCEQGEAERRDGAHRVHRTTMRVVAEPVPKVAR